MEELDSLLPLGSAFYLREGKLLSVDSETDDTWRICSSEDDLCNKFIIIYNVNLRTPIEVAIVMKYKKVEAAYTSFKGLYGEMFDPFCDKLRDFINNNLNSVEDVIKVADVIMRSISRIVDFLINAEVIKPSTKSARLI